MHKVFGGLEGDMVQDTELVTYNNYLKKINKEIKKF